MRKKIILLIAAMLSIMLLTTGCGPKITSEQMKDIALNVSNSEDYKLPDGYDISFSDKSSTNLVDITNSYGNFPLSYKIITTFDISNAPVLLSYTFNINSIICSIISFILCIILISVYCYFKG